jgi:hypothetical protein
MSSRGAAFLALWNGFDPALLDEYECWHTFEHVPERLSVPGFLSARRYAADQGESRRFFTLYEIETLEVLETLAYQRLVDQPTSWSAEMRRSFRDFRRYPCRRVAMAGYGLSGAVATLTFSVPASTGEADRLAGTLNRHFATGRITSFQVGTSIGNPQYSVFHQDFSSGKDSYVIAAVVEATSRRVLDDLGPLLVAAMPEQFPTALDVRWETFDFLYGVTKPEMLEARSVRLPPREELRALFRAS